MELARVLGILLLSGILAVVCEAACDAACLGQCSVKVQECSTAMEQPVRSAMGGDSTNSKTDPFSLCVDPSKNPDTCGLYTQFANCLNNLGAQCLENEQMKASVDQSKASAIMVCSANATCLMDINKCACKIIGDRINPLGKVCTGYTQFRTCMNNLRAKCDQDTEIGKTLDMVTNLLSVYRYVYCTDAGGCPQAMTCLNQLVLQSEMPTPAPNAGDSGSPMGADLGSMLTNLTMPKGIPDANLLNICRKLRVFDCLKSASATCKLDQGDVTMDEVKTAYTDLCTNALPQVSSIINCQSFLKCLTTFKGIPDPSKFTGSDGMPTREGMESVGHYLGSTMRTGFWCSWLKHNYQCAIDNAQTCSLSADMVSLGNQKLSQLQITCQGAAVAPPPTFDDQTGGATSVHTSVPIVTVLAVVWAHFM